MKLKFIYFLILILVLEWIASCNLARIDSLSPPTAAFSVDKTSCEAPCTITITNNSSNSSGYRWDFGNGQSSDAQNPNKITYTTPGMYNIQLIAIGEEGIRDTMVVSISISEKGKPPVAKFSVSNNNCTAPCDPGFVNESLNGSTYRWEFGSPDSTSTAMSPQHTFKKGGDYPVKLRVTNAFGSDTTTVMVKIMDRPTAKACFTYTAGALVAPATVTFDATCSTPNAIYTWDFGDTGSVNNTAAGQRVQHVFSKAGKYKVKLSVNLNGVAAEQTQEIEIKLEPVVADFSFTVSNDGFIPTIVTFSNKSSGNASSFQWNFGDTTSGFNNTSTLKDPRHTFNASGTYIVTLTATDANGVINVKKDTINLKLRTFSLQLGQGIGISVFQTLDDGYLISTSVGWIKTDQTGKKQWEYIPNTNGFNDAKAVQAANGDYYLAHEYATSNGKKVKVIRLNSNGNFLKEQSYNTNEVFDDSLGDILINKNRELILYGVFFRSNVTPAKIEAKLYRLDLALTSSPTSLITIADVISVTDVNLLQASDATYFGVQYVAGSSKKHSVFALGSSTINYKWKQDINDANLLSGITQVPSGSLFVTGLKTTNKAYISRHILGTGVADNSREYDFASSALNGITSTQDGQIIVCGKGELFLSKINISDLKEIWRKPSSKFSGAIANGIATTKDGGYIITGSILNGPNNNIYLLKTDQKGDL